MYLLVVINYAIMLYLCFIFIILMNSFLTYISSFIIIIVLLLASVILEYSILCILFILYLYYSFYFRFALYFLALEYMGSTFYSNLISFISIPSWLVSLYSLLPYVIWLCLSTQLTYLKSKLSLHLQDQYLSLFSYIL